MSGGPLRLRMVAVQLDWRGLERCDSCHQFVTVLEITLLSQGCELHPLASQIIISIPAAHLTVKSLSSESDSVENIEAGLFSLVMSFQSIRCLSSTFCSRRCPRSDVHVTVAYFSAPLRSAMKFSLRRGRHHQLNCALRVASVPFSGSQLTW